MFTNDTTEDAMNAPLARGLLTLALVFGVTSLACTEDDGAGSGDAPAAVEATEAPQADVSLATYDQVETGMDYEEVADIFGSPGELVSEVEMAGIQQRMVVWKAGPFGIANATITFQNAKVYAKGQVGLE
jgi:hypothetical protein